MLTKDKLDRLNILAKKAKSTGLTEEETKERKILRDEYLGNFRKSFRQRLDSIEIVDPDEAKDRRN